MAPAIHCLRGGQETHVPRFYVTQRGPDNVKAFSLFNAARRGQLSSHLPE